MPQSLRWGCLCVRGGWWPHNQRQLNDERYKPCCYETLWRSHKGAELDNMLRLIVLIGTLTCEVQLHHQIWACMILKQEAQGP